MLNSMRLYYVQLASLSLNKFRFDVYWYYVLLMFQASWGTLWLLRDLFAWSLVFLLIILTWIRHLAASQICVASKFVFWVFVASKHCGFRKNAIVCLGYLTLYRFPIQKNGSGTKKHKLYTNIHKIYTNYRAAEAAVCCHCRVVLWTYLVYLVYIWIYLDVFWYIFNLFFGICSHGYAKGANLAQGHMFVKQN